MKNINFITLFSLAIFVCVFIQSCAAQREIDFRWNINDTTNLFYKYKNEEVGVYKKVGTPVLDTILYGQEAVFNIIQDSIDYARVYFIEGNAFWSQGDGSFPMGFEGYWTTMDSHGNVGMDFRPFFVNPILLTPDKLLKIGDTDEVDFQFEYYCTDTVIFSGFSKFEYMRDTIYKNRKCALLTGQTYILPGQIFDICNAIHTFNLQGSFIGYFDIENGYYVDISFDVRSEYYQLPKEDKGDKEFAGLINFFRREYSLSLR